MQRVHSAGEFGRGCGCVSGAAYGIPWFAVVSLVCLMSVCQASAQDLEPRAYVAAPVGLNFVAVSASHSRGDVLLDTSLPLEDIRASVNVLGLGYGRTFAMFDRTALLVVAVPVAWFDATGRVGEELGRASRTGLGDGRIRLSVNLLGGRALPPAEFARATRPTIVGVSFTAAPPIGQYDRSKLVNIGANRWSFKPEIGVSHRIRRWTIEGYAGAWLFTRNETFYPGDALRTQAPIVGVQVHASYTFKPGWWVAGNGTWYSGGTTTVNGIDRGDLQRNSRLGATMSLPLPRRQSIKIAASAGATTRRGTAFKTIAAAWQLSWFDHR